MKILILTNDAQGFLLFRKELLEELLNAKSFINNNNNFIVEEILVCAPNSDYSNDIAKIGCMYKNVSMDRRGKNPLKDYKLIKEYERIIDNFNPNVILTYTIKPNIYGGIAAKKQKIPYIVNITGLGTSIHKNNITSKFIKKLYKIGVKGASEIFVQNKSNLEFFKNNILADANYNLIPGSGINLERFVYKEYPSDTQPIKFITIGRIMKDKGIDELLESIVKIKKEFGSKVEFHIAGSYDDVSYKDKIDSLNKVGTINYLGLRNDIPQIIGDYHCIIHPSYHEGLSNVLLEAGATGRPVIASNVPGCKETFIDGVSGLAVRVKDSDDLIRKIEEFINIPYEKKVQMGKANREHVEKNFDRKIVVQKYIECIEKYAR